MTTGSSNIHFLKFCHFNFSKFHTLFVKIFTKKPLGFKIDFGGNYKVLLLHQYLWSEISRHETTTLSRNETTALWFFFKFTRKSLLVLKFCQMRVILKPQFCWYFSYVLLRVILMEMKVSQVGCFQITGLWICSSIFSDISFIVFFTRLLSKSLWRNYPFSAQISKIHFKM